MDDVEVMRHLARVDAQITALRIAVAAIARTHPEPARALAEFDRGIEVLLAHEQGKPVADEAIDFLEIAANATRVLLQAPKARGA